MALSANPPQTPSTAPDPTLLSGDTSLLTANPSTAPPTNALGELPDSTKADPPGDEKAKSKRRRKSTIQTSPTLPLPSTWTYIHLSLIHSSPPPARLDEITARTHLTSALSQFLGHLGAAISVDILRVDGAEQEVWIRVPKEDGSAVVASCGGWVGGKGDVGWRVKGWGEWLGGLVGGDGMRLFAG